MLMHMALRVLPIDSLTTPWIWTITNVIHAVVSRHRRLPVCQLLCQGPNLCIFFVELFHLFD